MECSHCQAVAQRGRFCVGCGRTMPPPVPALRAVRLAPRPALADELTQPVLRLGNVVPRPRVPQPQETAAAL